MTDEFKAAFLEALRSDDDFARGVATAIGCHVSINVSDYWCENDMKELSLSLGETQIIDYFSVPEACRCRD